MLGRITHRWKVDSGDCGTPPSLSSDDFFAGYTYYDNPGYPQHGQLQRIDYNSHLAQLADPYFYDSFTYDALARPVTVTREINGLIFAQSIMEYDRLGRPVTMTLPGGTTTATTYDAWGGNILKMKPANGNWRDLVENVTMNTRGQVAGLTRGNKLITSYSYYGVANGYRPQQITVGKSGGSPLVEYGYSYDAIGQITTLTAEIAGDEDTQTFTYDTLGRLRTATGSGDTAPSFGMTYEYDDLGNLVTIEDLSGANTLVSYGMTPGQPHAVQTRSEGGQTYNYGYDALGQMTMRQAAGSSSVITYTQTFDALGRMTTVTDGSDSTYFAYDANGVRVLTIDADGNTIYTPFPEYEREVRSTDTIQRWTFLLDGATVATRVIDDPDTANNGLYYVHGDHLGSMTVITNNQGNLKDSARYYPYGGRRVDPTHEVTDSGYTGHRHNDDLGLIYMVARYYDPALRRFISADTIIPDMMDTTAYNRFAYVNNNPVNFTDPTGHCIDGLSTMACVLLAGIFATHIATDYQNLLLLWPLSYPRIDENRVEAPTSKDLTGWLIDQMVTISGSEAVATMQEFWGGGNGVEMYGTLVAFIALVQTDAVWDFKKDIRDAGIRSDDDLITLGSYELNYQAVANIFFGFIGRQIGMGEGLLQAGAGLAQLEHGWEHWRSNFESYPAGLGDQEFDAWSIGFGFYLFELFGNDLSLLTKESFTQALEDYIAENPIPPGP